MTKKRSSALAMTLGASAHALGNRQVNDYYATDPQALSKFLKAFIKRDNNKLSRNIWEPACGEGNISKVFVNRGYSVKSSDIVDRGYGEVFDFLKSDISFNGDIVTNPPFKYALEFVIKSLRSVHMNRNVVMMLRIQFLESKSRKKFFMKYPPKYVYVHSERASTWKNNDREKYKDVSALCYCWIVWQKGYRGDTILKWI